MSETIHEIVRRAEQNLVYGTTQIGEHVSWSMHDTLEKVTAYLNSKHVSGPQDALGRDKPFFNIVTAATNIWYRATDIDRKDIRFIADKQSNTALVFIANILLQNWMNKHRYGQFLNQWGRTLSAYGSAVVEHIERDGDLIPSVVPWNRVICDPVDFDSLPRIKKLYKTPPKLLDMATKGHPDYSGYDLEVVKGLLTSRAPRKNLNNEIIDLQSEFIEIYEVHGELSMEVYKESKGQTTTEQDKETFRQQMHVISFVETKDGKRKDFTLFSGFEEKDPQMITHLIEEDGRSLSIGAVEYLFDAQWMQNHTIKAWKDQMDLASRLVFQTADPSFVGRNVLSNIETGDIMIHAENRPLEALPNMGHDIGNLQSFSNQWRILSQELTSTPDAVRGNTLPSGTPYALGNLLTQNATSLFEIMTENKGLAIEEMLRRYVIPHLRKKLRHKDEIVAILDDAGIKEIDAMYIPKAAVKNYNERTKNQILTNPMLPVQPFDQQLEENRIKVGQRQLGNKRFFKPDELGEKQWNEIFSDFNWDSIRVEVTNEGFDKSAMLTTLSSVLQTVASNPLILQDPNARMIFNKILSVAGGVSPLELSMAAAAPQPQPANPNQPSPVGGNLPTNATAQ